MLSIGSVERVLDKRTSRGASDEDLIQWLKGLKIRAWKHQTKIIDGFIDAIKQTPLIKKENYEN